MCFAGSCCQGATFENISNEFQLSRDGYLNSVGQRFDYYGNETGIVTSTTPSWTGSYTVNDDYAYLGHSAILDNHDGIGKLVDLLLNQNGSSDTYFDYLGSGDGEGNYSYFANNYATRANLSVFQTSVMTFYQPSWHKGSFSAEDTVDNELVSAVVDIVSSGTSYFKIVPVRGESIGEDIVLTVDGYTDHTENTHSILGSTFLGFNNVAAPGVFINGVYHQVDGIATFNVKIGDIIGMQASVGTHLNAAGQTVDYVASKYLASGLFASSLVNAMLPITAGIVEGQGLKASGITQECGENKYHFENIFIDEIGTELPLWFDIDQLSDSYSIVITDNSVVGLNLGNYSCFENVIIEYLASDGLMDYLTNDYYGEFDFGESVNQFKISGINWDSDSPEVFSLGLRFAGTGTQVDVYTAAVPEPSSILTLGLGICSLMAGLRRRSR